MTVQQPRLRMKQLALPLLLVALLTTSLAAQVTITLTPAQQDVLRTVLTALLPAPAPPARTSDYTVHIPPATPAPAKGAWLTDPTFGSRILRVTGGSSGSVRTQSSGWAWSADGTKFTVLGMGGGPILYTWNGTTATLVGDLPLSSEAVFDKTDPNLVYGEGFRGSAGDEAVVRSYNLTTKTATDLIGVRDLVPTVDLAGRTYLRGIATSKDSFTFLFGGPGQDDDHYVYVAPLATPRTGTLIDSVAKWNVHLHAISMDQTGRYLFLGPRGPDIATIGSEELIWDRVANTFTPVTVSSNGHGALGPGEWVNNNDDADSMEYRWRALSAPSVTRLLVQPFPTPPEWFTDSHLSWVIPRHSVVAARYRYSTSHGEPPRAFEDELIEIDIASGLVKRIAHHQSIVSVNDDYEYWSSPKPSVSPDGTVCLFTSNWRRTLGTNSEGSRQDVFLVVLRP